MSQTKAQLLEPTGVFTLTNQLVGVGATFSGDVSIGGTLTKQDVTNVDSVGVITARSGVNVTGGNVHVGQGGSGANNAELKLQAGAGTGNDIIAFLNQAGATRGNLTYDTDNNFLLFNVNQGEKLRISSTGDVTLGYAGNSLYFENGFNNSNARIQNAGASNNSNLRFLTRNAGTEVERLRITSAGLVGIGTANPSAYLDVESNASSGYVAEFRSVHSSNSARILVDSPADNNIRPSSIVLANAGTDKWGIGQVYGSSSSGAFHICTGSASESNSKLTITTSGLVGIGTINPTRGPLHVHENSTGDVQIHLTNQETGTTSSDGFTIFSGANAGPNAGFVNRESGGTIAFYTHNGSSVGVRLTLSQTGNLTSTGIIADRLGGDVRRAIQNTKTSAYTLVETDTGKHINISSGGVTVPNNVMLAGAMITIVNNSGSDQTITQGSGVTLYNSADASTGNRTLAGRGMATILFTSGSIAHISGSGLS